MHELPQIGTRVLRSKEGPAARLRQGVQVAAPRPFATPSVGRECAAIPMEIEPSPTVLLVQVRKPLSGNGSVRSHREVASRTGRQLRPGTIPGVDFQQL